jgi:hypothetical protein
MVSDSEQPGGEFNLYTKDDGQTRVECRFEDETIWLSQALIAELFDRSKKMVSEYLGNSDEEGELSQDSVIRNFRTTAADVYHVNELPLLPTIRKFRIVGSTREWPEVVD